MLAMAGAALSRVLRSCAARMDSFEAAMACEFVRRWLLRCVMGREDHARGGLVNSFVDNYCEPWSRSRRMFHRMRRKVRSGNSSRMRKRWTAVGLITCAFFR